MRGPYRRFSSSTTFARWRALVLIVAAGMALLPLPANQARGAGPGVRLDWGTKARMPTARQTFGLAAAGNRVGGVGVGIASRLGDCSSLRSATAARVLLKIDKRTGLRFLRRIRECAYIADPTGSAPPAERTFRAWRARRSARSMRSQVWPSRR